MVRPSRSDTKLLQTSDFEAEFHEDLKSGLHFELRGCTPENKCNLWIQSRVIFSIQSSLQTPELYFGANYTSNFTELFSWKMLRKPQSWQKSLTKRLALIMAVFVHFHFCFLDVLMAKSNVKWESSWRFAISATCYDFGNGSKLPRSQLSIK